MSNESRFTSPNGARHAARVHGLLLGAAFTVGVGSFVASTLYSDAQLRDVEPQTDAIAEHAIPAIAHLSALRADLRDVDMNTEDEVARHAGAADRSDRAMHDAEVALNAYMRMPSGADEQARAAKLPWSFERIQQSLREVREKLASGDVTAASARYDSGLRFHIHQLDLGVVGVMDGLARDSRAAAIDVARERRRARTVAFSLDGVSLAASLAFGALVFARIRRDDRARVEEREENERAGHHAVGA